MRSKTLSTALLGAATLTLAACGGDDDGGTINSNASGLDLPSGVGILTDEGQSGGTALAGAGTGDFDADADYFTDEVSVHYYDQATEPLEIINDILTAMRQTAFVDLVNDGPYRAMVEVVGGGEEDGGGQGGTNKSSGSSNKELEEWFVNSIRSSNTAPHIVRFWIPTEEEFGPGQVIDSTIYGRVEITEAPTAALPYGDFTLNFGFVDEGQDELFQRGILETVNTASSSTSGFRFMMDDVQDLMGGDMRVAVERDMNADSGVARVSVPDFGGGGGGTIEFTVAFDPDYFLRSAGGTTTLFDRDQFTANVWQYDLYWAADGQGHVAGERVDLQSGFPFSFEDNNETYWGWVDYWGVWTPEDGQLADGDTVTREDGNQGTYTVQRAPGRLIKVVKEDIPLTEVDGELLEYWDPLDGKQYLVQYTHDSLSGIGDFDKIAELNEQTWEWENLGSPVTITVANGEWLDFWSESLGGGLTYIGGETDMTARKETVASGEDGLFTLSNTVDLHCLTEALKPSMTASMAEIGDIYMANVQPNNAYVYTFRRDTRTLEYNGAAVTLLAGEEPQSGPFMWGMRSGPMTTADPQSLGITEPWEMWNLDEYYYWETGANQWNQWSTVLDSQGQAVEFDAPMSFLYEHSTANDANGDSAFDGKTVFLQYAGNGNLWGIPHVEVDIDQDSQPDRWFPQFSIKDGVTLGPTGTEFVIKAREKEMVLAVSADPVPQTLTDGLSDAGSLTLPTIAGWQDPTGAAIPKNTELKVFAGELIDGGDGQ